MPSLVDHLRHNDACVFEAEAQAERNGSKWRAIDGSVKVRNAPWHNALLHFP